MSLTRLRGGRWLANHAPETSDSWSSHWTTEGRCEEGQIGRRTRTPLLTRLGPYATRIVYIKNDLNQTIYRELRGY